MYYDGRYMDGCPIDVCDPSQVNIRDLHGGHVGKPNVFHGNHRERGRSTQREIERGRDRERYRKREVEMKEGEIERQGER